MISRELAELVSEIERQASLPLEAATTLPPQVYRSEEFLAFEKDRLFCREWICAGRVDEIPNEGDWFCVDIAGEPVLVVRGAGAEIRALSNVCAHRWTPLKSGRGHSMNLECPYHAWKYDLSGRLRGAPHMNKAKDFELRDVCLPSFRTETWLGFIFVNLDPQAEPLGPRLTALEAQLAPYVVASHQTSVHIQETWEANWKIVVENAMESYHVFRVHPDTIDPFLPTKTIQILPGGPAYNLHSLVSTLAPKASRTFLRATIYPSLVIDVGYLDRLRLSWLTAIPAGVGKTAVFTGQAAVPLAGETLLADAKTGNDLANAQDRPICESVQRGANARNAGRGRLSHLEAPLWEFARYLSSRLAPSVR